MVLEIPKGTPPEKVRKMVDEFEAAKAKQQPKKSMRKRYGSMPGVFGDPLAYQKMIRSEWD